MQKKFKFHPADDSKKKKKKDLQPTDLQKSATPQRWTSFQTENKMSFLCCADLFAALPEFG